MSKKEDKKDEKLDDQAVNVNETHDKDKDVQKVNVEEESPDTEKAKDEKEILINHYLDEKGFLLQRRGEVLNHLGKKRTEKANRKWLDSKMKSYKGKK